MSMNRRGFLKLLGIGAAAAVAPAIVVPERRIWAVGFGASRDVHGALGVESGTRAMLMHQLAMEQAAAARASADSFRTAYSVYYGRDFGFGHDAGYVWARYDEATGRVIAEPLSNPSSLLDLEAIIAQDLTPIQEQLSAIAREHRIDEAKHRLWAKQSPVSSGSTLSREVLWTGITASNDREQG